MQQSDISRNKDAPEERRFSFLPRGIFFLAVAVLLSVLSASPAYSEPDDGRPPDVSASTDPQTNNCAPAGANLSGSFATPPCTLTETSQGLSFALQYYGGEQVVNHLEDWWTKDFLPALKSMHKQLTGSLVNQTMQFGTLLDAQNTTRAGNVQLKNELKNKLRDEPGGRSCVSGTALTGMGKANSVSNAYAHGMTKDVNKTSSNVKVDVVPASTPATTTTTTSPATTAQKISPAEDQKKRWDTYCAEFYNEEDNNGVSACPEVDPEERYQTIPDGDISVESFLLNDTIDLEEPHHGKTAWALLRNLVEPKISEDTPATAVDSVPGREAILKQQHLASVRSIASNVISSIISRRAAIASASTDTEPDPDAVAEKVELPDGSNGSGLDYAYNFAYSKINPPGGGKTYGEYYNLETGNTLCQTLTKQALGGYITPVTESPTDGAIGAFRTFEKLGVAQYDTNPPKGAAVYFNAPSKKYGHTGISEGNGKYIGVWSKGFVGRSSIEGDVERWKKKMPEAKYLGYVIPLDTGQEMPLLPPKPVGDIIRDIRIKAGVDPDDASPNPSYNEMMLALTKERFLDPEYFTGVHGDVGAIKQEQTINNAYITIQYQDIYRLQEQINALLTARASLKLNKDKKSSQTASSPTTRPSN